MTENKRFTIEYDGDMENIIDNRNGEVVYPFDYVQPLCDLLNELNDEKNHFKQELKDELVSHQKLLINVQNQLEVGKTNTEELLKLTKKYCKLKKEYTKVNQQNRKLNSILDGYDSVGMEKFTKRFVHELEKNNMRLSAMKKEMKE